eukprot:TRINITY_DN3772_c0_g2_i1.p1 TRINITY_DN3772_c0_g2~~TRINITY_DN3772_c0_g2_i1.p1  ORF type:complete len:969 (-),score=168.89 TRINITY_DN3772_c0_g2_i1:31-2937(-)
MAEEKEKKQSDEEKVPSLSLESKLLLQKLKIWEKVAEGELHAITNSDVAALFDVLDPEEKGQIPVPLVFSLLELPRIALTHADLKCLCEDADRDCSGFVTPEEFFTALTFGEVAFSIVKAILNKKPPENNMSECSREELLQWLKDEYETTSALFSLPLVLGTMISYILWLSFHFDTFNSYRVHNALQTGAGDVTLGAVRPWYYTPKDHMKYLYTQWVDKIFRQDFGTDPIPGRVYRYNGMIGGVRLHREYRAQRPCDAGMRPELSSLYNAKDGMCWFQGEILTEDIVLPYHMDKSIHIELLKNLTASYWFDVSTTRLEHQILYYNGHINLFTLERWTMNQQLDGHLQMRFHFESFIAEPYRQMYVVAFDVAFALLLIRATQLALAELIPAIGEGIDGLKDFFNFWKIVDWVIILGGFCNLGWWMYYFVQVNFNLPEAIRAIPKRELDDRVLFNSTYLTESEVSEIIPVEDLRANIDAMYNVAVSIYDYHMMLRCMIAIYFFALILKIFNSFRANPRLSIVVNTLVTCSVDVSHFFIVVFAIFSCFGLAGHLLLGQRHKAWSTVLGALYACWTASAGIEDFDDFSVPLQVLGFIWTLVFEILVQRICLNMLLGIVFDAYGKVKGVAGTPQTIIEQVREAVANQRETRGFVSFYTMVVNMEDANHPAHPGDVVTARSLRRAFEHEKMTRTNAEYLVKRVNDHVNTLEHPELDISDAVRLVGHIRNTMLRNLDVAEDTLGACHATTDAEQAAEAYEQCSAWAKHSFSVEHAASLAGLTAEEQNHPDNAFVGLSPETCAELETHLDQAAEVLESCWREQEAFFDTAQGELQSFWQREDTCFVQIDNLLHELEAKLRRVEKSIGGLGKTFSGVHLGALSTVPERMKEVLDEHRFAMEQPQLAGTENHGELGPLATAVAALRGKVDELSQKSGQAAEVHESLWKLEMSLRQIRNGRPTIPMSTFMPRLKASAKT